MQLFRCALFGAAAGAAGTTALNGATYLDMALRGRPASRTPEESVEKLAGQADIAIPGDEQTRQNRVAGLGPLLGLTAGVGTGMVLGGARGVGLRFGPKLSFLAATGLALVAGNAPMTALGITDPRTWKPADWVSDIVPHLAYGAVTASVLRSLDSR